MFDDRGQQFFLGTWTEKIEEYKKKRKTKKEKNTQNKQRADIGTKVRG